MNKEQIVLENILTRRSVRSFAADAVTEPDLNDMLRAAMQAPSAGNEQAWEFVVLTGTPVTDYLAVAPNVPKGVSAGILVCLDMTREKYPDFRTASQDCAAAVENILLVAHAKGLGAVWTAVFPEGQAWLRTNLGLPEGIVPFAFIPVGRPAQDPPPVASRFDTARVHRQKW